MRRSIVSTIVGALTFALGCFLAFNISWKTGGKLNEAAPGWVATPALPEKSADPGPAIAAHEPETPDNLGCWGDEQDPRFGPVRLAGDRILTTICGTLYVRDPNGSIVWETKTGAPLVDTPKIVGGELVVIGNDLHLSALNPKTGAPLWEYQANGRAAYAQLERYGSGRFLVLLDMSGYDDAFQLCADKTPDGWSRCPRGTEDRLRLFRKDQRIREWSVPAGAKVEVAGGRIFVSWRAKGKRVRRQIFMTR
jgi:hypothetical protein